MKTTKTFCSAAAVLAASASVAFVSGGPHLGAAASQTIPWMPGRNVCGKPGLAVITWTNRMGHSQAFPYPALQIAAKPVVSIGQSAGSYAPVMFWAVVSKTEGSHASAYCRRAATVVGTTGVHQTAAMENHTSIACSFPKGMQVQGLWLDKGFHTAQLEIASGNSRAAVAVATMSLTGTKLTYNPQLCHKVAFNYDPSPAATPATTTSTTTDTTTTP